MTANKKLPVETPREWYRFADENREVAERELKHEQSACHTVCFLCQSAAEKYLKGYLIAHGWTLEKTHDISRLLELCAEYDRTFTDVLADGETLNEYMTEGRYPGDLAFETIGREDAEEALHIVRRIRTLTAERATMPTEKTVQKKSVNQ